MKRKLFTLTAAISVMAMALVGCSKISGEKTPETTKSEDSIVGSWEMDLGDIDSIDDVEENDAENTKEDIELSLDINLVYTFNKDGTGDVSVMGEAIDFTYEIDDDKITMITSYEDETSTEEGTFEVDGDVLKLISEDGTITELNRVKENK